MPIILLALTLTPLSTGPILLWFGTMAACLVASALIGSLDIHLYGMAKRIVDTADPRWLRVSIAAYLALFVAIAAYGAVANAFAEDRAQREQAILERVPAEALRDLNATRAAVDAPKLRGRDSLRGEVTEVLNWMTERSSCAAGSSTPGMLGGACPSRFFITVSGSRSCARRANGHSSRRRWVGQILPIRQSHSASRIGSRV